MRLFVAEKPSVAKAIAAELGSQTRGDGYIQCGSDRVTWCFGHILEMAMPQHYNPDYAKWRTEDLPIIPNSWELLPKSDAKKQLSIIGKLLKEADEIVNAGDPDREGQLLVDEVLEHFKNQRPVRRFWVSAQDSISIQRGLAALKDNQNFRGFRDAALARGRADWLIGMNFSRAYTLRAQRGGAQKTVLTVGRVQTPTLALVVARDREVEAFKPVPYHLLIATVEHANGSFRAKWQPKEDQTGLDFEGRLVDTAVANALAQLVTGKTGVITAYKREPKSEGQPRVYSLASLTLAASNKFGYSAEYILKACQSLYETHKLASYPRTDCDYLPESQHGDALCVLKALKVVNPHLTDLIDRAEPTIKSKTWDDRKITAHHGIIPTMHHGDSSKLSVVERNIYELIVRAYLAQFYPAHEYMSTSVTFVVEDETFTATGKTITKNGWRDVYQRVEEKEKNQDEDNLPTMQQGDEAKCERLERKDLKTKPPARFTEGTLQAAMENIHKFVMDPEHKKLLKEGDGIGTPATRATIISELKRRKFLDSKSKQIISTDLGRGLIDVLPKDVKNPSLTAIYERLLKAVEHGETKLDEFLSQQIEFVRTQVTAANNGAISIAGVCVPAGPTCPECGKGTLRRIQRKDKRGYFWGCSAFKDGCKVIRNDKDGAPDLSTSPETKASITGPICPECGKGTLRRIQRKDKGGYFWGCSAFKDGCKAIRNDKDGIPDPTKPKKKRSKLSRILPPLY